MFEHLNGEKVNFTEYFGLFLLVHLAASWGRVMAILGHGATSSGHPGRHLGAILRPSWGHFGVIWGTYLGIFMARMFILPSIFHGFCWCILILSGAVLEPSQGNLGAILKPSLGHVGVILGPCLGIIIAKMPILPSIFADF